MGGLSPRTPGSAAAAARWPQRGGELDRLGERHPEHCERPRRDEEDFCGTGLTARGARPRAVRAWVAFQALGLLFQWSLWREVRGHLARFDETLREQCSERHAVHGVCLGPMWNVSSWQDVVLDVSQRVKDQRWLARHRQQRHRKYGPRESHRMRADAVEEVDEEIHELEAETAARLEELRRRRELLQRERRLRPRPAADEDEAGLGNASCSWNFSTRSWPPTFLVAVAPTAMARFEGEAPPPAPGQQPRSNASGNASESDPATSADSDPRLEGWHWSLSILRVDPPEATVRFHQEHAGASVMTLEDMSPEANQTMGSKGRVVWQATLANRAASARQVRVAAFVEDSTVPHLAQVHSASRCSFAGSWKAFNRQHQGRGHSSLDSCCSLMGTALIGGLLTTLMVPLCSCDRGGREDCCEGYGFHVAVVLRFFLVDLPQQACAVVYLLGWYEADGLRCQLCLFHPAHCEEEHPFHAGNSAALLLMLASSVSSQLLVRPARRKGGGGDTGCRGLARFAAACVCTLPLTTGVFYAGPALLPSPQLTQLAVALPCAVGWITVAGLAAMWVVACCE